MASCTKPLYSALSQAGLLQHPSEEKRGETKNNECDLVPKKN